MKYDVTIEAMDHMGRGISHIDNKIVFIPKTLIGEECTIKITKNKKNYYEAELLKIIKRSPKREKSRCKYFSECGGCDLLHMNYDDQLTYKKNKVKNIISRYTSLNSNIVKNILGCDFNYLYRNKVNFKVRKKIGFYKKKSYDIIDINRCSIADSNINNILQSIRKNLDLTGIKEITIRSSVNKGGKMVIFNTDKKLDIDFLKDNVNSIIQYNNGEYKVICGDDFIIERVDDYNFVISPDSFFQINTKQILNLYDKIVEYGNLKKEDCVLDLYSGTGTIGIYLSKYVKKVIGIEINRSAVKDAFKNKELNNITNIDFLCGDTAKVLKKIKEKFDVVIVDPPRSGLDDIAINNIKQIGADRFIYVSCNPITLARDLEKFKDLYDVIEITPVDMFPNTYHVECVCILNSR